MTISKAKSLFELVTGETVSSITIGNLFRRLRNIASLLLDKKKIQLGGENSIVEIDESLAAKVKHHIGKDLLRKQVWIFGMKERTNERIYMEVVPDRTGFTLLGVIFDNFIPRSLIFSDSWSSYSKITLIKDYRLEMVNHK